jgi:hypothetical protein
VPSGIRWPGESLVPPCTVTAATAVSAATTAANEAAKSRAVASTYFTFMVDPSFKPIDGPRTLATNFVYRKRVLISRSA